MAGAYGCGPASSCFCQNVKIRHRQGFPVGDVVNIQRGRKRSPARGQGESLMARPITMKALDELVAKGATLQFVGIGKPRDYCEYWIAVALPLDVNEEACVLVASNSSNIRTLRHKGAIDSIVERYPEMKHIQTMLLPLLASIDKPERIYLLSRAEIQELDQPPILSRRPADPES